MNLPPRNYIELSLLKSNAGSSPANLRLMWLNHKLDTEKGDTGAQGVQGIQGIQGVKGDTGDQGEPGPSMTVAMGVINQSAQIIEGYNVTSCEYTSGYYRIALTGITYADSDHVTLVTPMFDSTKRFAANTSFEGNLMVFLYDATGTAGQCSFSFMVLECP